jgi:hypothetical protein
VIKTITILQSIIVILLGGYQVDVVKALGKSNPEAGPGKTGPQTNLPFTYLNPEYWSQISISNTGTLNFYKNPEIDQGENNVGLGPSDLILPDLQTLPPTDLIIQENQLTSQKLLRFSNSIVNIGPGILELKGIVDLTTGNASISQQLYTADGSIYERTVSDYVFHPIHDHWHFYNSARYELWTISSDWGRDAVISMNDKVSFCLRDIKRSDGFDDTDRPVFTRCGQESQGISPGWIDTYLYYYDGQSLDITGLPDGIYVLRSIVDPEDQLWEVNSTNNDVHLYIRIEGNTVEELDNLLEFKAKDKLRRIH